MDDTQVNILQINFARDYDTAQGHPISFQQVDVDLAINWVWSTLNPDTNSKILAMVGAEPVKVVECHLRMHIRRGVSKNWYIRRVARFGINRRYLTVFGRAQNAPLLVDDLKTFTLLRLTTVAYANLDASIFSANRDAKNGVELASTSTSSKPMKAVYNFTPYL